MSNIESHFGDREDDEYNQRLDCLHLAVRMVQRWPPPAHPRDIVRAGADGVVALADHFREYLNARDSEDEEE